MAQPPLGGKARNLWLTTAGGAMMGAVVVSRRTPSSRRVRARSFLLDEERLVVLVAPLDAARDTRLSPAEQEVVAAILEGKSNAQIALARGTSIRTVANQVHSAMTKLGVSTRAEIVAALLV